jgi:lysophospholipase L1-like esterase
MRAVTDITDLKKFLVRLALAASGLVLAGALGELLFMGLEAKNRSLVVSEGSGFGWDEHPRWGWATSPGPYRVKNHEFDVSGLVTEDYLNEGEDAALSRVGALRRVLALGDSHTAAVGVSSGETWVKQLQAILNGRDENTEWRCFNAAAAGYSLHQYLARLKDQGPLIDPEVVVVGFSFATDLYDLLPPARGGWIYGGDRARVYYELTDQGDLEELVWLPPSNEAGRAQAGAGNASKEIRNFLGRFATFRYLRRSPLALLIGAKLRVGGQSLWPNMEVVVARELTQDQEWQYSLAYSLLREMRRECERLGCELVILGIPYLAQVYDDVWASTFGDDPDRHDRFAANSRLAEVLESEGVPFVDTTLGMVNHVRDHDGQWLHYPDDAHPTKDGQRLIAEILAESSFFSESKK